MLYDIVAIISTEVFHVYHSVSQSGRGLPQSKMLARRFILRNHLLPERYIGFSVFECHTDLDRLNKYIFLNIRRLQGVSLTRSPLGGRLDSVAA
jgi:hypothetical protein